MLIACNENESLSSKEGLFSTEVKSDLKGKLYQQKLFIDTLFKQQTKKVFVKLLNNDVLEEVVNEKWPEEIEITYNFLKDPSGRVIRISEFPYSESGDQEIIYSHYFDKAGNTFAFERVVSAFNTYCPGDDDFDKLTIERIIKLYNLEHTIIDSTYRMIDEKNLDITKKKCEQEIGSHNQVFSTLREYTTIKKIKI